MKKGLGWFLLLAAFLALNALLVARMHDEKAGAIQASALSFDPR